MNRILATAVMLALLSTALAGVDPVVWFDMDRIESSSKVANLGTAGAMADLDISQGCSLTNEAISGTSLFMSGNSGDGGARFMCPALTNRTVSCWIRRDVDTGDYTQSSYPQFLNGMPGDDLRIVFNNGGSTMTVYVCGVLAFNEYNIKVLDRHVWEHFAFSFEETSTGVVEFKLYFNGLLLCTKSNVSIGSSQFGGASAKQAIIGGNGKDRPIRCCTDEFRIWDRVLSASEVQAEYFRVMPSPEKSIAGFWKMDAIENEGSGRFVRDASTWTNNLMVGGGVTAGALGVEGGAVKTDGTKTTWGAAKVPSRFADYTLTAWINQSVESPYDNMAKIGENNGGPRFMIVGNDELIFPANLNLGAAVLGSYLSYPCLAAKGRWSHFAFRVRHVWNQESSSFTRFHSFYMNGEKTDELTTVVPAGSLNWKVEADAFNLFNLRSGFTRPFEGLVDDVRLYSRALDDGAILEIARGPAAVSAGADFSVDGAAAVLRGEVAAHGSDYFRDGFAGSVHWMLVSAPQGGEGATIQTPASAVTAVTLPVVGEYVFRLVSSAGGYERMDDVTVTRYASAALAPVISLPAAATVMRPLRLHLEGTVSGSERVFWRKVSGPGGVWFESAGSTASDVTFSAAGVYVLRLTAENCGAASSADISVTVSDSNGTVALDDGLKIHWPMDIGNMRAERISRSYQSLGVDFTNTLFVTGARLHGVSAVSNNAYVTTDRGLYFERSADGSFGYSTQPTSKWVSVSMWIYRDSRITHEVCVPYLLSAHQSLGLRYGRLDTGADGFTLQQQGLYGGTANLYFNAPSRSVVDRWTHVYALYDRADGAETNFALYLDGERQTSAGSKGFPYVARIPNSPIEIGGIQPGRQVGPDMGNVKKGNNGDYYSATFPGTIDDIRIYNRPLTEAEIRTLASRPNLSENLPPVFSIETPLSLSLVARKTTTLPLVAFDDGLPTNGVLTCEWQIISGDADNVVLDDPAQPASSVMFKKAGNYVLRLMAMDGERSSHSPLVSVNVLPIGTKMVLR